MKFKPWALLQKRLVERLKRQGMMATESKSVEISMFEHTPFYCEENVYMLCKKLCTNGIADAGGSDLFVAFVSNESKKIPLWHQKASQRADGAVIWDYHVICIQRKNSHEAPHLVWDLDSTLSFPCPLISYISEAIRPSLHLTSKYQRLFRIVHAPIFLGCFASDRRHMKDSNGDWIARPPPYESIVAEDGTVHNLNEFIDMRASFVSVNAERDAVFTQKLGVVIAENKLEEYFSHC